MISLFSFLFYQGLAFADEYKAEQKRIRGEILMYRKRSDWANMNHAFDNLLELKTKKYPLNFSDYILGAYAAQELGMLEACVQRLKEAMRINPQAEEGKWLDFVMQETELVSFRVAKTDAPLDIADMPFDPILQHAIEYADTLLKNEQKFNGRLPFGIYSYGAYEFTVAKGEKVRLRKKEKPPEEKLEDKKEKQEEKNKPKVVLPKVEDLSYAPFGVFLSMTQLTYSNSDGLDYYNFAVPGIGFGFAYRYGMEELLPFPLILEGSASGLYFDSERINAPSILGTVFLKYRVNNFEFGVGYFGDVSLITWSCSTAENPTCKEDVDPLHASSGVGGSVLWDVTPYLGIEVTPSITLDETLGLYTWLSMKIHISIR